MLVCWLRVRRPGRQVFVATVSAVATSVVRWRPRGQSPAIDLNPSLVEAHTQLSNFLAQMGRNEEAIVQAKRAVHLDPLDLQANEMLAQVLIYARQFDVALDQIRKLRALDPTYILAFYILAIAHALLGEHEAAMEACIQGLRVSENDPYLLCTYGWICGLMGRRQDTEKVIAKLQQRPQRRVLLGGDDRSVFRGIGRHGPDSRMAEHRVRRT